MLKKNGFKIKQKENIMNKTISVIKIKELKKMALIKICNKGLKWIILE